MDITMPATFPETEFQAFRIAALTSFLPLMSDENLSDPQEKRRQFDWSWQAVRYRYRICAECRDEFKTLFDNDASDWREWSADEEQNYKLERCIYLFFMSGLSVFDSFAFCLYFYGNALEPGTFPDVANPRNITRNTTSKAFNAAFSKAAITGLLAGLSKDMRFTTIDVVRNLVGHRISGSRSVRAWGEVHPDGTYTHTREATWHLAGSHEKLIFDEELIQRQLDDITRLLTEFASAAREFAESNQPAKAQP